MTNTITMKSPGKVNLTLDIHGKLDDGYHQISTVMQIVDLHDNVTISPSKDFKINVSGPTSRGVPKDDTNICYKVFKTLQKVYNISDNVQIDLEKNIPIGGGMGGGSSNAATTMKLLSNLWNLRMSQEDMQVLSTKIGMDVPFFFSQGTALATGKGEQLEDLPGFPESEMVIINPKVKVPTKDAYENLELDKVGQQNNSQKLAQLLRTGAARIEGLIPTLHNDFESSIYRKYPKIRKVVDDLQGMGFEPHLTGSGSCIFLFADKEDVKKIRKSYSDCYHCKTSGAQDNG